MLDNKKYIIILILLGVLLLVNLFKVTAATYYVSPDGKATWPECKTIENPCKASNNETEFLNAPSGAKIIFLDGVYQNLQKKKSISYIYGAWSPKNSNVTFKALNTHKAILVGAWTSGISPGSNIESVSVSVFTAVDVDNIVFDGFTVRAVNGTKSVMSSVQFRRSNNSIIKNCLIEGAEHSTGGANNYEGIRGEDSDFLQVYNCTVRDFIESSGNYNTSGFKSYRCNNLTIKNNDFFNNTTGIFIKGSPQHNVKIVNNYIYNNIGQGIHLLASNSPVFNATISNNLFVNNGLWFAPDEREMSKIDNLEISNNTFWGKNFSWSTNYSIGKGPRIYNNIIANVKDYAMISKYDYGLDGPQEIDHNCIPFPVKIRMRDYSKRAISYYSLSSWNSSGELANGLNPGDGSFASDPLFLNYSKTMSQKNDFILRNDSPCRQAGRYMSDIGADISLIGVKDY